VFNKGPLFHGITDTSEFAQYTSNGKKANPIGAPFTLVINPIKKIHDLCINKKLVGEN